jgi:hypothetical protein
MLLKPFSMSNPFPSILHEQGGTSKIVPGSWHTCSLHCAVWDCVDEQFPQQWTGRQLTRAMAIMIPWPYTSRLLPVGPSKSRAKVNDEKVCNTEPLEEWTITACSEITLQIIHTFTWPVIKITFLCLCCVNDILRKYSNSCSKIQYYLWFHTFSGHSVNYILVNICAIHFLLWKVH